MPLQQFRSKGHNSNSKMKAPWADHAQPSLSPREGIRSPFTEKPPENPEKNACLDLTSKCHCC